MKRIVLSVAILVVVSLLAWMTFRTGSQPDVGKSPSKHAEEAASRLDVNSRTVPQASDASDKARAEHRRQDDIVEYDSFAEEIEQLADEEREYIQDVNASLYGALKYESRHQAEWKKNHSYPTVSDVLYARQLSDEELTEWALSGDPVGAQLHFMRLLDDLTELETALGVTPSNRSEILQSNPEYAELLGEIKVLDGDLSSTESPFSAYLTANLRSRMYSQPFTYSDIVIPAILGDRNARDQILQVQQSLQPQGILSADGVLFEGYDRESVDAVLAFFYTGILNASMSDLVCNDQ